MLAGQINTILGDEMGLGKTVQSSCMLQYLYSQEGNRGPFLVVAPMATIEQWRREIQKWTHLNCVVFHGNSTSRERIIDHEWRYEDSDSNKINDLYKFNVLVTTYEMIVKEHRRLSAIKWEYLVIDEGHRIKNRNSKLFFHISKMKTQHSLILTGTPLQNGLDELWTMLHFCDPKTFKNLSVFMRQYEDLSNAVTLKKLHNLLRPYLLRRLKEDVEDNIPAKEETIVEVDLTTVQKTHYRAILEKNREFLSKGSTSRANVPNLINVMMELRKCCNHPYLINGAEARILGDKSSDLKYINEMLIKSSAKLVLLDKLLQKLRTDGHKVLIFSQMVRILDILEDYIKYRGYPFERLDGGVARIDRQSAIDRFQNSTKKEDAFIFLLSTKAGGLGLNLTAADTVVIYDSDWNPQNDLQAMARCHRIGQKANVKIYRLTTKGTYEKYMLEVASKKLGLNEVVLGKTDSGPGDATEIDRLLRLGAYHIFNEGEDKNDQTVNEDIDQILDRATVIRYEEDKNAGTQAAVNGFSKVSFQTADSSAQVGINDEEFWEKILPEFKTAQLLLAKVKEGSVKSEKERAQFFEDVEELAKEAKQALEQKHSRRDRADKLSALLIKVSNHRNFTEEEQARALAIRDALYGKRRRTKVNRNVMVEPSVSSDDTDEYVNDEQAETEEPSVKQRRWVSRGAWKPSHHQMMKSMLLSFGFMRWKDIHKQSSLYKSKTVSHIQAYSECFVSQYVGGVSPPPAESPNFYAICLQDTFQKIKQELVSFAKAHAVLLKKDEAPPKVNIMLAGLIAEEPEGTPVHPGEEIEILCEVEKSNPRCRVLVLVSHKDKIPLHRGVVRFFDFKNYPEEAGRVRIKMRAPGFIGAYEVRCIYFQIVDAGTPTKNGKPTRRICETLCEGTRTKLQVTCLPEMLEEKTTASGQKNVKPWINKLITLRRLRIIQETFCTKDDKYFPLLQDSDMPKLNFKDPCWWWETQDDRSLLAGTLIHGLAKVKVMREDERLQWSEEAIRRRFQTKWDAKSIQEKRMLGFAPPEETEEEEPATTPEAKKAKVNNNPEEASGDTTAEQSTTEAKVTKSAATMDPFAFPRYQILSKRLTRLIALLAAAEQSKKRKADRREERKHKRRKKKKKKRKRSHGSKKKKRSRSKHRKSKKKRTSEAKEGSTTVIE